MTVFLEFLNDPDFFSKIGLRYFLPLNVPYLHAKFQVDPMVGSIITFVTDGQTDRRTDGRSWFHKDSERVLKTQNVRS